MKKVGNIHDDYELVEKLLDVITGPKFEPFVSHNRYTVQCMIVTQFLAL
jgi:hypothetical protein